MKRVLLIMLGLPLTLLAHHSFSAEYDAMKPVTLKGTVTKIEWRNPHIYFFMDVTDNSGKLVNWAVSGGSATQLYRHGYTKNSLQPGNQVTMEGFLARDGSNLANMSIVTIDGKKVLGRIESPDELK